ncbi:MAG: hypothetical protein O3A02_02410 [bacterium]|nr:hypothetical protein [bacterium]
MDAATWPQRAFRRRRNDLLGSALATREPLVALTSSVQRPPDLEFLASPPDFDRYAKRATRSKLADIRTSRR